MSGSHSLKGAKKGAGTNMCIRKVVWNDGEVVMNTVSVSWLKIVERSPCRSEKRKSRILRAGRGCGASWDLESTNGSVCASASSGVFCRGDEGIVSLNHGGIVDEMNTYG